MENSNKRKYEYVIGIDFGHGETSAALCALQWDTPIEQLNDTIDLDMIGSHKVIPSAITLFENGDATIGSEAFDSSSLQKADVNVCFKKAPVNIDGESEQLMKRYMKEVYHRIRENNPAILTDSNHLVYIATPSGWNKPTQDLYLKIAREAGLPMGGLTKESRAAFVRAQNDVTSGLGQNTGRGIIVFDMGSSTLDFTYMNNSNSNQIIDHGYDCGASHVEKEIYKNLKLNNNIIHKFEEKYPHLISALLFETRKIKEEIYNKESRMHKGKINFDTIVDDEEFEDKSCKVYYDSERLNQLLEENGYIKEIEDAMNSFKCNNIQNAPIYGVFLTGGASRMDFIKPLVSKCWNISESQIFRDSKPSLTISQGVAEVARMDLRTDGMDTGLEEAIDDLLRSDAIYESFVEKFGYTLWNRLTDEVGGQITAFRDSAENYSISDLEYSISITVENSIEEESQNISLYIQEAVAESTQDIREKVNNIIAHYSKQGMNIQLKEIDNSMNVAVCSVELSSVLEGISDRIASESSNWTGVITGAAVGGAIAILLGGPLFWLIGGAAWLGSKIFGESEEEKKANAKSKKLDFEERSKVYDSIASKWEEITGNMETSIRSSITQDKTIKHSINTAARQLLHSYKKSLKDARILID